MKFKCIQKHEINKDKIIEVYIKSPVTNRWAEILGHSKDEYVKKYSFESGIQKHYKFWDFSFKNIDIDIEFIKNCRHVTISSNYIANIGYY